MKKIIVFILLSFSFVCGQKHPVAGEIFTIRYNPAEKNIFDGNESISIVYAFDFWGTTGIASGGAEELFKNVLDPDEGRKYEITMVNKINYHEAEILIPDSASLISYYFTNGKESDYNDKKTYISYIYSVDSKPVKGARFRSVDFMIMGGKSTEEIISVLKDELKDYPGYHVARFALWQTRLEQAKDYNEIVSLKKEFENEFETLKKQYLNDYELLNAEGKTYTAYSGALQGFVYTEYKANQEKIIKICEQMPEEKRSSTLAKIYERHQRSQQAEKFKNEAIGKAAVDFEFKTIKNESKKLSDFKGKYVLLDFWGTWCGPCRREIPNMKKAYAEFKEKGFEIISISSDLIMKSKNEEDFKKFIDENEMTWTQLLDSEDKRIHKLYKIAHWPTLFLLDKNGNIIKNEDVLRGEDLIATLKEVMK